VGYLTKYGSFWGQLPQTSGRLFWVAPTASYVVEGNSYPASDNNDGLSPERALLTIDYAVGLTTANAGDVIVLLPGSHTVTAAVTLDVAGITITGIPGSGPREGDRMPGAPSRCRSQVTTSEAAGNIFSLTAAGDDVEIAWIHFNLITQGDGIVIPLGADRPFIHDCTFAAVGTASSTSECIHFSSSTTGSVSNAVIRNCYFLASGNQGPAIRALGTVLGLKIESSTFELQGTAAWDDAIEILDPGSLGTLIRDCDFVFPTSATTVITNCIELTGVTVDGATKIYRCYFDGDSATSVNASATPDRLYAGNFRAQTTAGTSTL
jgi:hypothetical protein